MKKFFFLLLVLIFSVSAFADFLPGTEDIPAMDDMTFSDDVLSFDAPEGQILIISGTTKRTPAEVNRFYKTNLSALGWTAQGRGKFTRGTDSLKIDIERTSTQQNVKFNLTLSNE